MTLTEIFPNLPPDQVREAHGFLMDQFDSLAQDQHLRPGERTILLRARALVNDGSLMPKHARSFLSTLDALLEARAEKA
jgi:hypothetical protein